jgi:hypothetical protein
MRKDRAMAGRGQRLAFDPVAVGRSECDAWAAYYRHDWPRFLAGALDMVRHGFSLGAFGNVKAAWHVMRANQVWAPYPDNDPEAARQHMTRFYRMADRAGRLSIDPRIAAQLEVAWWHTHRAHSHAQATDEDLLAALVRLYCYVTRLIRSTYAGPPSTGYALWLSPTPGSLRDAAWMIRHSAKSDWRWWLPSPHCAKPATAAPWPTTCVYE